MTQIFRLPEDIRQEFSIDEEGKAYASQSAIARLCGVTQQAINQLLEKLATSKTVSESLQPFNGNDYMGTSKIPDVLVAAIINHYAMYARNATEQAKKVCLCSQAIGIRTWIQEELGWQQKQQSTLAIEDAIALSNVGFQAVQNIGIDKEVAEQIRLQGLIEMFPESEKVLKPYNDAIAASNPLPEAPMTPTEVGQKLAVKLGHEKVSAKKINSKLLELGYQISVTRIKRSNGKEVHDYYLATDKGKPHSQLQLSAYVDGEGRATKAQLRWFTSIVDILANNWE